jgi:polyribonucleotide nucleotidyltransferase
MEETSQSTGRLAKQADGSVVVRIGKTVILGTVVSSRKASPVLTFTFNGRLPKFAAGRFPVVSKEKRDQVIAKC